MREATIITLRTGREVPESVVKTVLIALSLLATDNPVALYELRAAAADPGHEWWPGTAAAVIALGLARETADGAVLHEYVRDVVLAAVEEDGMTLVSPFAVGGA
jgi:hypothetical protein